MPVQKQKTKTKKVVGKGFFGQNIFDGIEARKKQEEQEKFMREARVQREKYINAENSSRVLPSSRSSARPSVRPPSRATSVASSNSSLSSIPETPIRKFNVSKRPKDILGWVRWGGKKKSKKST